LFLSLYEFVYTKAVGSKTGVPAGG